MKLLFKVSVVRRKLIPKSKTDEFAENFKLELWLAETSGIISTKRLKQIRDFSETDFFSTLAHRKLIPKMNSVRNF